MTRSSDNITDFFERLTNPVAISVFHWEYEGGFFNTKGVTAGAWAEHAVSPRANLIHYNQVDRGGHFAAWEQPQLFSAEVRAAFRTLR